MTRPIKFRAWDTRDKRWATYKDSDGAWMYLLEGELLCVKDVKVMQFTGLLDKNGKEIYEGDVLRYHGVSKIGKVLNPVIFKRGRFWIEPKGREGEDGHRSGNYFGTPSFGKMHEIIGNIYENPELLNQPKK